MMMVIRLLRGLSEIGISYRYYLELFFNYNIHPFVKVWSFKEGNLIETISWSMVEEKKYSKLYSASFGHSKTHQGKYILAGGGGAYNDVKLFNIALKKVRALFFLSLN
jgi:hypothetical protein